MSHGTVARLRAFVGSPGGPGSGGPTVRRWKRWLRIIRDEIWELSHKRGVFQVIAEAFQTNPVLQQSGGTLWLWLAENYASTAAVAVRRQADRGGRRPVASFESLLSEIAASPGTLTPGPDRESRGHEGGHRGWWRGSSGRKRPRIHLGRSVVLASAWPRLSMRPARSLPNEQHIGRQSGIASMEIRFIWKYRS